MSSKTKYSAMVAVTAVEMTQKKADINGLKPIMLISVAGLIPNRNVLSGTVADSAGFKAGSTYLAQVTEGEADATYGRRFNWLKMQELNALEIVQLPKALGKAGIFDVTEAEEATETENKQVDAKAGKAGK